MDLAHDEDGAVRWAVLCNAATPEAALRYLSVLEAEECSSAASPWFIVRERVLAHPNTGEALEQQLLAVGVVTQPWMTALYDRQRPDTG